MHGQSVAMLTPLTEARADLPAASQSAGWDLRSRVEFALACAFGAGILTFVGFALTHAH